MEVDGVAEALTVAESGDECVVNVKEIFPDALGRGVEERRGSPLGLRRAMVWLLAADGVRSLRGDSLLRLQGCGLGADLLRNLGEAPPLELWG